MILSASGWRKVFAKSLDEQDKSCEISENDKAISVVAADIFFEYIQEKTGQSAPLIALGMDTRPTGTEIADAMLHALVKKGAMVQFTGICSAPEIMAFAKGLDGFIYISASHNPIGHNGIKFGINDGGVLNGTENAKLVKIFLERLSDDEKVKQEVEAAYDCNRNDLKQIYQLSDSSKHFALRAYSEFLDLTVTDTVDKDSQKDLFDMLEYSNKESPVGVVCDFNGSSRAKCVDKEYFKTHNINFYFFNENEIVHEIIPEAENLVHVAQEMERLQAAGYKDVVLGYMPDCDGDRGNIVYWDEKQNKAVILKAQEVFSLSVLAELTFSIWKGAENPAVCVNCPTSMRIDEICKRLGAKLFRAEVGEANVVNCAREKRNEGYTVRILGEGSNGGTITYPSSVRDPLNTIFAIIKLLSIKEDGLFELWCKKSGIPFNPEFTLTDILNTLPVYTTTGVSEPRAITHVKTTDHAVLKKNFQKIFETEWENKKTELELKYGITGYEAVITNGTKETCNVSDYSLSQKGGLKIIFKDKDNQNIAFIWMRGSGTEPVFRIMCDVKGLKPDMEKALLAWETDMLSKADNA